MSKMTPTNRTGLTLIELMVAVAVGLIVMMGTTSLMAFAQRYWNREWDQANLQRDAARAMLKVKQSIRGGTHAELDIDGHGVTIHYTAGSIRFWFVPGQMDLRYQLAGEAEQTLLDGTVENATFQVDTTNHKTVTVGLELQKDNCEAQLSSTTLMRNYAPGI